MKICNICHYNIISIKHKNTCITINMFEYKTQNYLKDFKPMMTHGLCGSTTIIAISDDSVHFYHHPTETIVKKFLTNICAKNNIKKIIIKLPISYIVRNNKVFKFLSIDLFKHIHENILFIPYSINNDLSDIYFSNSSLNIRKNKNDIFEYTENYGIWKELI